MASFEGLLFLNITLFIPSENSQYFFHSLCKGKGTLWNLEDFFQQKAAFFMIILGIFSTFKLGNSVKWYQSGPASYSLVWYTYFRCSCWIALIIKQKYQVFDPIKPQEDLKNGLLESIRCSSVDFFIPWPLISPLGHSLVYIKSLWST